jgi:hypothetical protein
MKEIVAPLGDNDAMAVMDRAAENHHRAETRLRRNRPPEDQAKLTGPTGQTDTPSAENLTPLVEGEELGRLHRRQPIRRGATARNLLPFHNRPRGGNTGSCVRAPGRDRILSIAPR